MTRKTIANTRKRPASAKPPPRQPGGNSAAWVRRARSAGMRGEQLLAFDLASQGLAQFPDDLGLKRQSVYALLRSGAPGQAWQRFRDYGLPAQLVHAQVAALHARLLFESAFEGDRLIDADRLNAAADAYRRLFEAHQEPWYGINAASLNQLAGRPSDDLARAVLRLSNPDSQRGQQRFAAWTTCAQAHLLRADHDDARTALARARTVLRRLRQPDFDALTGVRMQLRRLCPALGLDPLEWLAMLPPPGVAFFFGRSVQLAGQRGSGETPLPLQQQLNEYLRSHDIRFGYGSLAAGADISCAEALLAHGAALHVVLPCNETLFETDYVAVAGRNWLQRYRRARAAATTVSIAADDAHVRLAGSHDYAMDLGIGTALLRARSLDTPLRVLALSDDAPGTSTSTLLARCQALGLPPTVLEYTPAAAPARDVPPTGTAIVRRCHAILFGDLAGFSNMGDADLPLWVERVLGGFAAVLKRHGRAVLFRNTWGDGLFVVVRDAVRAADIAGELHAALAAARDAVPGSQLALRLGLHFGPVLARHDPVLGRTNYFGSHVSRTARIEPVTPAGQTYVTEAFAAQLLLQPGTAPRTEYVGEVPAAKGYGKLRMYVLKPVLKPD